MPHMKSLINPSLLRQWLPMGMLLTALGALYYPSMVRLVRHWHRSDDYSHGFLIIPLSLYIIWQKREALRQALIAPAPAGLAVAAAGAAVFVLAQFAGITTLAAAAIIPILLGSVWFLWGPHVLKELLFPIVFLIFMVPVPGQIYSALTFPLQLFVSASSTLFGQLLQIPIYREGNIIHLPQHTLQVVQACSGLRSMISLLTLSAVMAYLTLGSNLLRALLFVSGVPVAILVNVVRVSAMILAFHHFDYDLTEGALHSYFGAAIFLLAILLLVALKGLLSRWDPSPADPS
jgi:exosortase